MSIEIREAQEYNPQYLSKNSLWAQWHGGVLPHWASEIAACPHCEEDSRAAACGVRPLYNGSHAVHSRIVGGLDAEPGEFPWQVSLIMGSHFCGASILSPIWLISAAHCFPRLTKVVLRVGTNNWKGGGTRHSAEAFRHEQYNDKSQDNDIALLKVDPPIELRDRAMPICIPLESYFNNENYEDCWVTGWGKTDFSGKNIPDRLQKVKMPIINWDLCKKWIRMINENMLCAGYEKGGRDSCQLRLCFHWTHYSNITDFHCQPRVTKRSSNTIKPKGSTHGTQ
ncbi:cationic trypsin-like isoform X2 [Polyodon spathula]|uniref:cationic trypsin-like isoform X2 n=1 Tax=Polyodon spathula TaxID=7913 RepID=UPI001B7EC528|nr:cationic trypsin-like isoform X2 [Polyodon spathula]